MFWKKRIYADAAAAMPLSRAARKELLRLSALHGNPGALHDEAVTAKKELERARERVAASIGAHPDEIVFTGSGTESNNLALHGTLRPLLRKHGELNAITLVIEHSSVLSPLGALEDEGLYATALTVDSEGLVYPTAIADAANNETALVSVQLINSEMGAVQPIRDIAKEVRRIRSARSGPVPLYFHVDASQAPLWLDIKVEKLGVDLLTLDAQKVGGPKGVGALYIKRGTQIEPVVWGGNQEHGMRAGTENVAGIGAFAAALLEAQKKVTKRAAKVAAVRDYFLVQIKERLPDVVFLGPAAGEKRVANNLALAIPGLDGQLAVVALNALGIAASTRSACTTGEDVPSAVVVALGVPRELQKNVLRFTFLPEVTRAQAYTIAATLSEVAARYKKR